MPTISPSQASALQTGGSLVSSFMNMESQRQNNMFNAVQDIRSYNRMRRDALADRAFENQYNSPAEQMKRLKAAGLNPNMVYDSGGAKLSSVSARSTDFHRTPSQAPELNLSGFANSLSSYFDMQYKEAQTDNVKALTAVAQQEAKNKALMALQIGAQTANTIQATSKSKTDQEAVQQSISNISKSFPVTLEQMNANLRKINADVDNTFATTANTKANTQYTLDQNERAAAMNTTSIQEAMARILTMRKQNAKTDAEVKSINQAIENMKKDADLKQLDINLKKIGVNPSDPQWQRILGQALENVKTSSSFKQWAKKFVVPWK